MMVSHTSGSRLGAVAGALLALFTVPVALISADGMTDLESCGGAQDKNAPLEQFSLAAAKDIWLEFPAMGRAPEIETDSGPADVIVFKDGYDASAVGVVGNVGPHPIELDTVVCVIQADRTRTIYTNIPRQGSRFGH